MAAKPDVVTPEAWEYYLIHAEWPQRATNTENNTHTDDQLANTSQGSTEEVVAGSIESAANSALAQFKHGMSNMISNDRKAIASLTQYAKNCNARDIVHCIVTNNKSDLSTLQHLKPVTSIQDKNYVICEIHGIFSEYLLMKLDINIKCIDKQWLVHHERVHTVNSIKNTGESTATPKSNDDGLSQSTTDVNKKQPFDISDVTKTCYTIGA